MFIMLPVWWIKMHNYIFHIGHAHYRPLDSRRAAHMSPLRQLPSPSPRLTTVTPQCHNHTDQNATQSFNCHLNHSCSARAKRTLLSAKSAHFIMWTLKIDNKRTFQDTLFSQWTCGTTMIWMFCDWDHCIASSLEVSSTLLVRLHSQTQVCPCLPTCQTRYVELMTADDVMFITCLLYTSDAADE